MRLQILVDDQMLNDAHDAFFSETGTADDQLDAALVEIVGAQLVDYWRNQRDEGNLEDTVIVQGFRRNGAWAGVYSSTGKRLHEQWIAGELPVEWKMIDDTGKVHDA